MRHLSGRLLAAAAVVPVTVFASAAPAEAQDPFAQPAHAAASWLVAQSDGTSWNDGDVSTSLEAVIALEAARVGGDHVQATLEWLNDTATLTPYLYPTTEGAEPTLSVGAAGKVMFTVATAGGDPTNFGGIKLADEVTAAQAANGTYGDGTALSTAWAVLGLSRTDRPAGEEAASGFAAIQCPDGGFNFMDVDGGDDCVSDPDTTGLAASALATLDGDAAAASLTAAADWLESAQSEDGGVGGEYGVNANSTAMAAQAFLAAGRVDAAERAVAFLLTLQFDCTGEVPGAFRYTDPEGGDFVEVSRLLATAQAMVPVAGQNLAELDATGIEAGVPDNGCESAVAGDETADAVEDDGSAAWLPWVIGAAVVLLAALIIGFAMKHRRNGGPSAADGSGDGRADDGAEKP
ncbi:hypothetical protein K3N28_16985 [Glycomyces sp. TRM65418]|uniref:hypothetical protein n=1 Tax=Glycomyces sp. TRM65418 TaxID=2867006 RepID=UPI001CE4D7B8|nr:hypothetical protein [Glycomyces sp. TRM65418]MCC3764754.1 hypothetical protein [Glycomyces sp. TRM65418]QZD54408.1 hypothetical protein K3N28_16900 [Glycomyces sp. TRM65418]